MKILMFTPFAKRNGAEMMLLYIMENLDSAKFQLALFSFHKGELLADIPKYIPTYFQKPVTRKRLLKQRLKRLFGKPVMPFLEQDLLEIQNSFKADIWYVNTVLCPEAVSYATKNSIPYIIHFHELLFLYGHVKFDDLKQMVQGANLLIGCSRKVCDNLRIMGGVNIALQYECIDFNKIKINGEHTKSLKNELNIGNSFVWIMSGSVEYRKGADLIPSIAEHFGDKITIIWLGPGSSGYSFFIEQDIKLRGLKNVHFLGGKSEDYYDYLSLADGLILTSREDPFPLVMIEAGFLGKPIVAFNSGGVEEFIIEHTGLVVESDDLNAFKAAMNLVMSDSIDFDKGKAIKRAKEFDAKTQANLLQEILLLV